MQSTAHTRYSTHYAAMAALDESPPPPALQLITRSRSHGIEVVPAPSARDENQTLAVSAALGAKRSIAVASPGAGDWVALGGGNAPLEVAATRGGARATLLDDTAGCERFAFSPTGAAPGRTPIAFEMHHRCVPARARSGRDRRRRISGERRRPS